MADVADGGRRLKELERELARLARRVEKLENAPRAKQSRGLGPGGPSAAELAFVNGLLKYRGPRYETKDLAGAVAYAGAARFGDRQYLWIKNRGLPEVVEADLEVAASVLSALSSPPRLIMLRFLLPGPRTSQELMAELGISSAGQLYHHLKDLQAAGMVVQSQRGLYQIPSGKIVPILAILSAALDLGEASANVTGGVE